MKEKYVIINGATYYESQLNLMSDKQLKDLILKCQYGIEEIAAKKKDYQNVNFNNFDDEHFQEVLAKFDSASVYLQSDIVLLNNILKMREEDDTESNETIWYRKFYDVSTRMMSKRKWLKICNQVNEESGIELENLVWVK